MTLSNSSAWSQPPSSHTAQSYPIKQMKFSPQQSSLLIQSCKEKGWKVAQATSAALALTTKHLIMAIDTLQVIYYSDSIPSISNNHIMTQTNTHSCWQQCHISSQSNQPRSISQLISLEHFLQI